MSSDADTIAVSIIEHHSLYREAVVSIVERTDGLRLEQAVASVAAFRPSAHLATGVVILDLRMPGVDGLDVVRGLAAGGHRVLVLSASERGEDVLAALDAHACGYLGKGSEADQLVWAIRTVGRGEVYLAPSLSIALIDRRRSGSSAAELTDRERQVLVALARGLTDQEIARTLRIKVSTVRSHLDHIREKTSHRRRAELALYAAKQGWFDVGGDVEDGGRRRGTRT
jgi:DNA-binding NarL/FixJ family response regulator